MGVVREGRSNWKNHDFLRIDAKQCRRTFELLKFSYNILCAHSLP